MKVHILQHVPFEDIGSMAGWLAARGARVGYTRFFEKPELPDLEDLHLIIAMGGPMSVNDELQLPWLVHEKRFIRKAVARGVPVLGICLGAQLIASALGARVYNNPHKEIGWFPIQALAADGGHFGFPETIEVFHWHGETFDLPAGAVLLARSAACANQAFQLDRHVIGLQFHLETTPEGVSALLTHCGDELVPGPYVQSADRIGAASPEAYLASNRLMDQLLSYLIDDPG